MNSKKILIIIVAYNAYHYLPKCLDSLYRQTYTEFDILIVDNGMGNVILPVDSRLTIIKPDSNTGFTGGNNIGIQYAIDNGYKYTLLLNEDTIVDSCLLEVLLKYTDDNTVVAPDMYADYRLTNIWYSNGYIDSQKGMVCYDLKLKDEGHAFDAVTFITGCCELISTEIWKRIGFFSEEYFMYFEDADLSMRMLENGIDMKCIHETWIWHRHKKTGETKNHYHYYYNRNRLSFIQKYNGYFVRNINEFLFEYSENKNPIIDYAVRDFRSGIWGKVDYPDFLTQSGDFQRIKYDLLNQICEYSLSSCFDMKGFLDYMGYKTIAIYGHMFLGERICDWITHYTGDYIRFFIDKREYKTYRNIDTVTPDNVIEGLDLIIITAIKDSNSIINDLSLHYQCDKLGIEDFLVELENYSLFR